MGALCADTTGAAGVPLPVLTAAVDFACEPEARSQGEQAAITPPLTLASRFGLGANLPAPENTGSQINFHAHTGDNAMSPFFTPASSRREWLRSTACGFGSLALASLLGESSARATESATNPEPHFTPQSQASHLRLPARLALADRHFRLQAPTLQGRRQTGFGRHGQPAQVSRSALEVFAARRVGPLDLGTVPQRRQARRQARHDQELDDRHPQPSAGGAPTAHRGVPLRPAVARLVAALRSGLRKQGAAGVPRVESIDPGRRSPELQQRLFTVALSGDPHRHGRPVDRSGRTGPRRQRPLRQVGPARTDRPPGRTRQGTARAHGPTKAIWKASFSPTNSRSGCRTRCPNCST